MERIISLRHEPVDLLVDDCIGEIVELFSQSVLQRDQVALELVERRPVRVVHVEERLYVGLKQLMGSLASLLELVLLIRE